ncbi:MAG: 50S ribosomal protein L25 [Myxococcota bacterium]|jgi:large subunit ribosomal protein L25|nr:50S ribosomal protein L25 [Myxococcota bacterium]
MDFPKVEVSYREVSGKGFSRKLRRLGKVPAVLYGSGMETLTLSVPPRELVRTLAGPRRVNTPVVLAITGAPQGAPAEVLVMVRDHQYDPVSRELLHVDFIKVSTDKKVRVEVPVVVSGRAVGVQAGGKLHSPWRSLPLECCPQHIPVSIEVDVTPLEINQSIKVKDLRLSEGVSVVLPPESHVVQVMVASKVIEEKEEGTAVAAAAPVAAAPAPAAKKDDKKDAKK